MIPEIPDVICVKIYGIKRKGGGVNCLREVFEIFLKFNKILCVNPKQKLGYPRI